MSELIKLPTRYDEQWRAIRDADSNHVVRLAFTAEDSVGPHIAHVLNTHDVLVAAAKDYLACSMSHEHPRFFESRNALQAALAAGEVKDDRTIKNL